MKRDKNYDLLRVVSCAMVVLLHAGAFFVASSNGFDRLVGVICQAITRTAVPCFVMLSGAFLLNDTKWKECTYAFKKTSRNIILPTIVYSVLFILFSFLMYRLGFTQANYREVLILSLKGYPYPHMWYMYMCIDLYLATPVIWKIKECAGGMYTIALFLVVGYIMERSFQLIWPIKFVPFIGYFLFGGYVRALNLKKKKKKGLIWTALFLWVVFITMSCIEQIVGTKNIWGVLPTDPLCPLVVVASLACFVFFSSIEVKADTYKLAKHTDSIYFVHIVIQQVMWTLGERLCPNVNVVCKISVIALGSFVLALVYSILLREVQLILTNRKASKV